MPGVVVMTMLVQVRIRPCLKCIVGIISVWPWHSL